MAAHRSCAAARAVTQTPGKPDCMAPTLVTDLSQRSTVCTSASAAVSANAHGACCALGTLSCEELGWAGDC